MKATKKTIGDRHASERTLLLSANSSWNIAHFRSGLIRGLIDQGYRIVVAAPDDGHGAAIAGLGAEYLPLPIDSSGSSVLEDSKLLLRYHRILRTVRPFAFLGFTAKPNIYGSLAAHMAGTKVINNITGLGTVFIKQSLLTTVVTGLYRVALKRSSTVFFQNRDDLELFAMKGIVDRGRSDIVPGDGVDLMKFREVRSNPRSGPFRFLLIARLLWDNGVGEFVEAARIVRQTHPDVTFQLLGPSGVDNRTAVPAETVTQWQDEGIVEYLGECNDVRPYVGSAHCVVLPSYREGLPRTLLEGSAMGKPLIATAVPGCREVVVEGETGFLCEARSAKALAKAMLKMLELPAGKRLEMGRSGRLHVERSFSEALVVRKYCDALGRL